MNSQFASIEALDTFQTQQQERVRNNPTDAGERFRLFQVLAWRGDWDNADRQLRQALNYDSSLLPMVRSYQLIVEAEVRRGQVWRGEHPAQLESSDCPEWAQRMATAFINADEPAQLARNLSLAPALRGEIDVAVNGGETLRTHAFEWITDSDGRLGPILELIGQHGYSWMPMSELRELEIAAPESGCDRLWARAVITRVSGERMRATIPVRYVGDYESQSTNLLLGRETCWHPVGEERLNLYSGEGQRMWATEFSEYALLDVRAIRLRGKSA